MTNSKAYLTNPGTVSTFFDFTYESGYAQSRRDSNIFFEGNKLYSFGYHFPMVVAHDNYFFVNADRYSVTTSKHQSYVQRYVPASRKIEIPFSALESAGIRIEDIEVVDKESSRYVEVPTKNKDTGEMEMKPMHLMGSTLFKLDTEFSGERYFLSGIDETAKDLWNGFFLTELVGKVDTIEEAYASMKPEVVQDFERCGYTIRRQGEYFFVEVQDSLNEMLNKNKDVQKKVALSHAKRDTTLEGRWNFSQSRHVVTNYIKDGGLIFAKGTCRHVAGEHKMLKLDKWHMVYENVQEKSWTAQGRVD